MSSPLARKETGTIIVKEATAKTHAIVKEIMNEKESTVL